MKQDPSAPLKSVDASISEYLINRDQFRTGLSSYYPDLHFQDDESLTSLAKMNPQGFIEQIAHENDQIIPPSLRSANRPMIALAALAAITGVLAEGIEWSAGAKKPYVQGIGQVIAEYTDVIPDNLRSTVATLATYENQPISKENKIQLQNLINTILKQIVKS